MGVATGVEQPARGVSQGSRKHRTQPTIEFERPLQVSGNDVYLVEDGDVVGHGIHQQTAAQHLGITPPALACKMARTGGWRSGQANRKTLREGPLTEPKAATQPWQRLPLFMPHTGHCPELVGRFGREKGGHSL